MAQKRIALFSSMFGAATMFLGTPAKATTTLPVQDAEFLTQGIVADTEAYLLSQFLGAPSVTSPPAAPDPIVVSNVKQADALAFCRFAGRDLHALGCKHADG